LPLLFFRDRPWQLYELQVRLRQPNHVFRPCFYPAKFLQRWYSLSKKKTNCIDSLLQLLSGTNCKVDTEWEHFE